jgi:large subunit ribosomal protein L25
MAALQAELRDPKKTKPTHLRRAGMIPLALTRRDHTTISLQAPIDELKSAMKHADGHGRFELKLSGGDTIKVILKQQAFDWLHHKPLSATLQEVGEDDVLKLDVPITSVGVPEAVKNGEATLTQPTSHVKLRGKVADMPEQIEIDVSHLGIGDSISAHEVELPEGVDLLSSGDSTLFVCQVIRAITEADLTPSVGGEEGAEGGEEGGEEGEEEKSE